MQGLKIYTKSGEALTSEEIEFAHRVANQHKEMKFGVITMTDPTSGVVVDYHSYNNTAFTSGDVGAYFGYNASVDMRCWCRGVVLAETSAPAVLYVANWSDGFYLTLPGDNVVLSYGKFASKESAQAAADAINAANAAAAHQRSAVFLTDGTELGSVARYDIFDGTYTTLYGVMGSYLSDPFPWRGDSAAAVFNVIGQTASYTRVSDLTFTIPDEACYQKVSAPTYPDANVDQSIKDQWLIDWNAAQLVALNREHARRKKCSDGQLTYLRNGFLSPEFERFIKANHPISALLRRDIPMQIISNPAHTIINEERDSEGVLIARTYESRLTLRYETINDDGSIATHEKEFIGQVRFTEYTATYTNYPLLGNLLNGGATPVYTDFTGDEDVKQAILQYWIYYRTGSQIVHDITSAISSLFCEVNGTLTNNYRWNPTDEVFSGGVNYVPGETVQSSYGDLRISHPQFLLDYIAASKPIEKEIDINGNKVPVTPSTDWLSSRLAHNEVVTIIPLSFVNADGEDRGMYPYSRTDEVPTQVKLVGFAKVKYNYYTGSFTFVSWTEFTTEGNIKHDGNASYDAETNPTSVNIGGTVYTLQPKYFNYNSAWDTPNCVCIAGKTPWTDTKVAYKTQKTNIADVPPEGYTLTDEEILYNEVRKAIK